MPSTRKSTPRTIPTWPPRRLLGNYRSVPIKAVFDEHVLGIDDVAARDGVVAVANSGRKTFEKRVALRIVREAP